MDKSVVTYEKPLPHITLRDWYSKQWELQQSVDVKRSEAFELRNTGRVVRSETKVKTDWETYINNTRIADRITELSGWEEILQQLTNRLSFEMKTLNCEKSDVEKDIEMLDHPLEVTARCISMRDCRRGTELTYDEPDTELKKELCVIENIKQLLTKRAEAAWEKVNRLEDVRFKVNLYLEDIVQSMKLDKENLRLDRTSANMTHKLNVLRIPKNSVSYEAWLEHCRQTKSMADNELSDTYNFREAMKVMRVRAKNDIQAQQDITDFILRKRIYQTQKARNELEWQKHKLEKEMELLLKEIDHLQNALSENTDALKCAETRLENRKYRTGYELCEDEVEMGLREEVLELQCTRDNITKMLENAKASYNSMESLLRNIVLNVDDKQHSLTTDVMCLDMRSTLKTDDKTHLKNETDRNIVLTRMEKEIPLEFS